jgi:cytochrome P450
LRYTEAVILESMRCYPPVWIIGREALRDTELGGHRVPRGTRLWISPWVLHRDPDLFPQPESFCPERWLDGLQKRLPRFAYLPFGGGPRLCIGNAFAMTSAILVLATVASRFFLRVPPEPPLKLVPSITLRLRHGLRAVVEAV